MPTIDSPPIQAIFALAHRELIRFFRQRSRVIGGLVQPVIFWLLFSEGLKQSDLGYEHFFPGTLVMILLFTAVFSTVSVIEDRNEGFLQGVLVAPVSRLAIAMGKLLGGSAIAMVQGLLFLLLGWVTGTVSITTPIDGLLVLATMALIAIALTGLGFTLAWKMGSTQGFHAIMMVFVMPLWLLSGAFFPRGAEGWLGGVVVMNPLTYGVAGLRHNLGGSGLEDLPSEPLCLAITASFALVMTILSWFVSEMG